ncbi:cupin domain-containing protein [Olivibacter sp. SDN3]|uniref:cupin domain-containing protein n=1 Tax=Olivibacter sp. SDN3 TaxID=2764720 RepID=UPI001C9E985F|nr:cupin domain-containing protein [Olivibacter sp. SDN3]
MTTNMHDYIVRSKQIKWLPLIEGGKSYSGIYVKSLRYDNSTKRSKTILLKFEAGASYPYHNHPAGEELFILEGEAIIEGLTFTEGDYLYTPPDFKHAVKTLIGCTILFLCLKKLKSSN